MTTTKCPWDIDAKIQCNKTQMGYWCKIIADGCAYACALHFVNLNWTHSQTIARENSVRLNDSHRMHILWLNDFEFWMVKGTTCSSKS